MIATLRIAGPLGLLTAVLLGACGVEETGIPPIEYDGNGRAVADSFAPLYYPIGIAPHPDGRYLFVANAGFDRRYNAGTVSVYDTATRTFPPDLAVSIGLFAGDLVAGRTPPKTEGGTPGPVQLFVATRDRSELWRVVVSETEGEITGLTAAATRDFGGDDMSPEPYGLALDPDGRGLTVTHTGDGTVSRYSTRASAWETVVPETGAAAPFRCASPVRDGATVVARHPVNGWWFVSDRFSNFMKMVAEVSDAAAGVDPRDGPCRLVSNGVFRVESVNPDSRSRGVAFNRDGSQMFVAHYTIGSSGGAVRVFDTTVAPSGRPANRLIKAIGLGARPNLIRVAGCRPDLCPPETDPASLAAKGQGLVYVTAFHTDELFVIDPSSLTVIARIPMPDGPHDIVFMLDAAGRMRGYVTNFNDNSLSVLDLEPDSPGRFTVSATIKPKQPGDE